MTIHRLFLTLALLGSLPLGQAKDVQPEIPRIPSAIFDVKDFGLIGDGTTDDTKAVQQAIDKASAQGGGTVKLSKGKILCGPLKLCSHLRLQIEEGVMLVMLPLARYPGGNREPADFIGAKGLTDLAVTGAGTIEGQGSDWWPSAKDKTKKRPRMIGLHDCERILIQGLTLRNAPMFHIAIRGKEVTVSKVTVRAPSSKDPVNPSHNTDACDVSGHNILVADCDISVGDDNYTCGKDTSDVLIRNCRYGMGHGVSIGSYTGGGVSNFTVRDCVFDGTDCGIRIKSDRDRGGHLTHITYENLRMTNVGIPILIYGCYGAKDKRYRDLKKLTPEVALTYPSAPMSATTPVYEDITFRNITANAAEGGRAGLIWGLPEAPVGRLTMENVTIRANLPLGIFNVNQADLKNVRIITPDGENKIAAAAAKISLTK
jgi:polygalacturonase